MYIVDLQQNCQVLHGLMCCDSK